MFFVDEEERREEGRRRKKNDDERIIINNRWEKKRREEEWKKKKKKKKKKLKKKKGREKKDEKISLVQKRLKQCQYNINIVVLPGGCPTPGAATAGVLDRRTQHRARSFDQGVQPLLPCHSQPRPCHSFPHRRQLKPFQHTAHGRQGAFPHQGFFLFRVFQSVFQSVFQGVFQGVFRAAFFHLAQQLFQACGRSVQMQHQQVFHNATRAAVQRVPVHLQVTVHGGPAPIGRRFPVGETNKEKKKKKK